PDFISTAIAINRCGAAQCWPLGRTLSVPDLITPLCLVTAVAITVTYIATRPPELLCERERHANHITRRAWVCARSAGPHRRRNAAVCRSEKERRDCHHGGPARSDRASRHLRYGRHRGQSADAERYNLPDLLDDQTNRQRGRADAVRRGALPAKRPD